jgi:hypothetical protein
MSVSFSLGGTTATIQNPDLDDKLDLDPHMVVQPKADGGFYRYALAAVTESLRELKWSNLRLSELNDLTGFFNNQAQGSLNEFMFTDERGVVWAASFLNATLEPTTITDELNAGGAFVSGGNTIPTSTRKLGFFALAVKLHIAVPTTEAPTTAAPTAAPTTAAPVTPEPPFNDSPSADGYTYDATAGYYVSNDGAWYWDGTCWRELTAPSIAPPPADSPSADGYAYDATSGYYVSNDGLWYWTGYSWFATGATTEA